jgi:hypothetical protein
MKITRRGTSRDHGPATIELKNVICSFDPSDGMFHLKAMNVSDFRAEATHNYDVSLSPQELDKLTSAAFASLPRAAG